MQSYVDDLIVVDGERFHKSALVEQMERVVGSKHFRNSKRYPALLRFVVEETLAGRTESLKERTLGIEVFLRPRDYDTNADPIVRVTAGEIRKRIAQYYQEPGREHELRIELPLGAYVPRFFFAGHAPSVEEEEELQRLSLGGRSQETPSPASSSEAAPPAVTGTIAPEIMTSPEGVTAPAVRFRDWRLLRWFVAAVGVLLAGLLALGWILSTRSSEAGLNSVWGSVLGSSKPVLVVIGVHSFDSQGHEEVLESHASEGPAAQPRDMLDMMVRSDMVPVSDIVSYSRMTNLLTRHGRAYTTWGSADATLEQARSGPLVLIGGLDNLWTLRLTSKLRYRFLQETRDRNEIVDSEHPERSWFFDNFQKAMVNTQDYAIVASYWDSTIDQPVVIAAGIGKAGTEVAAEFLTTDEVLRGWLKEGKLPTKRGRNVELVLSTEILDGKAGPPHVVASAVW